MVRNYKRKDKTMKWSKEDMSLALDHARHHKNIKAAAKLYNIPATTLRHHLEKENGEVRHPGHPTLLSSEEEQEIVETCMIFAQWGFGLTRYEIEGIIQNYLKTTKRPNPFRDGVPGEGWWKGFMSRHPEIRKRKPQNLQMVRAKALRRETVDHWFYSCLKPTLNDLALENKPDHIYNVDESGFALSWTPRTVLSRRGDKSPQSLLAGSGRENITVQLCVSADGSIAPPYIVYKGERLMSDTVYGGPLGTRYSVSQNGWMTEITFLDWMRSMFIPMIGNKKPTLLILDGHSSHVSYEIRVLASQHDIHLLKLPPHTTHALQPLDVGVINHIKALWQRKMGDFTRRERRIVTKKDFPSLINYVWSNYKSEWGKAGFTKTGVVPFDPNRIEQSLLNYSIPLTSQPPSSLPLPQSPSSSNPPSQSPSSPPLPQPPSSPPLPQPPPSSDPPSQPPSSPPLPQSPSSSNPPSQSPSSPPLPQPPPSSDPPSQPPSSPPLPQPPSSSNPPSQSPSSFNPLPQPPSLSNPPSQSPSSSNSLSQSTSLSTSSQQLTSTPSQQPTSLRTYFATLLHSTTPKRTTNQKRKRLSTLGESLTTDEAIEIVRKEQEEKEKKEREKKERAEARKRKREEKNLEKNKQKEKKQSTTNMTRRKKSKHENQENDKCPTCNAPYDQDEEIWILCESCSGWSHKDCAGYAEFTEEEMENEYYLCDSCSA